MGAPVPGLEAADDATAETLLSALKSIKAAERRKHASVFNYWLSIRGDRQFPPIRDLDPLEISDAGPFSLLLEMIGGGEDAEVRHIGQAIRGEAEIARIGEAAVPSLLSCIAAKLPIVAATRQPFAFEEEFQAEEEPIRCWVTLLPFSVEGTWIDFVYGYVSLDPCPWAEDEEDQEDIAESEAEASASEGFDEVEPVADEPEPPADPEPDPVAEVAQADPEPVEPVAEDEEEPAEPLAAEAPTRSGFSARFFESLASVGGFYGRVAEVETGAWTAEPVEPVPPVEPVESSEFVPPAEPEKAAPPEPAEQSVAETAEPAPESSQCSSEGPLKTKLAEVRARADEARMAKLRANAALYEGLSAAYDFALDAESEPEEYLRLVEAQGLKIQLRSPMTPVVKLAFDGLCDESTIGQLEAVLAWALKMDLPRGSLADRIETEGGIGPILGGLDRAA